MVDTSSELSPKISWRDRLNVSRWAIAHPRWTLSFWLAVLVAGLLAFSSLKYALFPDITFPVVVVTAETSASSATETEQTLTQPLEAAVQNLNGLEFSYSTTYAGQTVLNLAFTTGQGISTAADEVETALQDFLFPADTEVEIIPIDLNESAVVSYALTSDHLDLEKLVDAAQSGWLPTLETLPGVLKVNLRGNDTVTASAAIADDPEAPAVDFPTLVQFDGTEAIALEVIKQSQANALEVVAEVENAITQLQQDWPDLQVHLATSQAKYIREATQSTVDALILAIALAVLVIFAFLRNWQATLITALAIPLSLLGTCIVMAIAGFNLETITLLALALVIGIIVDDAIVEVENIARHIEAGQSPRQAALRATQEIGLTVSASTLTLVAVFLPVAFMGGTVGRFFKPFGLTVSAAVLISLLVARTLAPVLAIYWLPGSTQRRSSVSAATTANQNTPPEHFAALEMPGSQAYRRVLAWSLAHRRWVIGLAIASFLAGMALIPLVPKGFIPVLDRGEFNLVYTTALPNLPNRLQGNASPSTESPTESPTNQPSEAAPENPELNSGAFNWLSGLAQSPEKILLRRTRRMGEQLFETVQALPEVESTYTVVGIQGQPNRGQMALRLRGDRSLSTTQVQTQLRQRLPAIDDVDVSVEDIRFVNTESEKALQIVLTGSDLSTLSQTAQALKAEVTELPGYVDVTISEPFSENIEGNKTNEDIENSRKPEATTIEHVDGKQAVYFSANLTAGLGLGDAADQVVAIAEQLKPSDVTLGRWGDAAHSDDVLSGFGGTLLFAIGCMLLVLRLPFGRWLEPLVVGLSLPLSMVGAMVALLITRSDFGMISLIGIIFLLGLLDKNAILLMDCANQLRGTGMKRREAILETGTLRLRPILMTTASTILGMLPIALGWGAGAELRQPMAVTIIGGLLTASLLSLIVVPVLYSELEERWNQTRSSGK